MVDGLRLRLIDLFDAPSVVYRQLVKLGPEFYGRNWTHTHGNIYSAIQMSKRLVGLLMSLIVAIAAFNVVSTLVLVAIDKQGDIAILRTLGASTKQIMMVFMVQGMIIGVLGTFFGTVAGVFMTLGVEDFVRGLEALLDIQFLKSDVYPTSYLPTELRLSDVLQVVATALSMSVLATLYPAWKASKVRPAEALRYE